MAAQAFGEDKNNRKNVQICQSHILMVAPADSNIGSGLPCLGF
mgnify:CR=1 FL=1